MFFPAGHFIEEYTTPATEASSFVYFAWTARFSAW